MERNKQSINMMKQLIILALILFTNLVFGQTWEPITSPTNDRINDVHFINHSEGWIVTDKEIFKTIDGGLSWDNQTVPPNPEPHLNRVLNRVQFINENVGIIACGTYLPMVGDSTSPILRTIDGGVSWVNQDIGNTTFNLDAILIDSLTSYSIGQHGSSKKSIDGGQTWFEINFSGEFSGNKLFPISRDTVYFVGLHQFFLESAFGKTSDNGNTWTINSLEQDGLTKAIYFQDANNGCIGGFYGDIKYTQDGGDTWQNSQSGTSGIINYFDFADAQNGWGVTTNGDFGEIIRTIDGGKNWSVEYSGEEDEIASLNAISITNGDQIVGYAVGFNGILKTTFTTSVYDKKGFSNVSIFPNPFNDELNLILNNNYEGSSKIEVYDLYGKQVYVEKINSNVIKLNLKKLPSSTYILKIMNGTKTEVKIVVKT